MLCSFSKCHSCLIFIQEENKRGKINLTWNKHLLLENNIFILKTKVIFLTSFSLLYLLKNNKKQVCAKAYHNNILSRAKSLVTPSRSSLIRLPWHKECSSVTQVKKNTALIRSPNFFWRTTNFVCHLQTNIGKLTYSARFQIAISYRNSYIP